MAGKNDNTLFWGLILVLLGILLILNNYDLLDFGEIVSTFWPIVLIIIGVKILIDKKRKNTRSRTEDGFNAKVQEVMHSDRLDENNVFGDIILNLSSQNFSGGSLKNVFGDIKVDLSKATLTNRSTNLYISGVFGDIKVTTPKDIAVKIATNAVIGDLNIRGNKRDWLVPSLDYQDENYETATKKLFIRSNIVIGDIKIT